MKASEYFQLSSLWVVFSFYFPTGVYEVYPYSRLYYWIFGLMLGLRIEFIWTMNFYFDIVWRIGSALATIGSLIALIIYLLHSFPRGSPKLNKKQLWCFWIIQLIIFIIFMVNIFQPWIGTFFYIMGLYHAYKGIKIS